MVRAGKRPWLRLAMAAFLLDLFSHQFYSTIGVIKASDIRNNQHMKFFTQTCVISVIFSSILFTACQIPESGTRLISRTADGLAIAGYDTVAYHTIEAAAQGKPEYEYVWSGAKWLFLSAENRDRFAAAPETYAPEYGGFCSWSISQNNLMEADPNAWKLIGGKLYLIQSQAVKEIWEKSQDSLIEKGDKNWQMIDKRPTANGK